MLLSLCQLSNIFVHFFKFSSFKAIFSRVWLKHFFSLASTQLRLDLAIRAFFIDNNPLIDTYRVRVRLILSQTLLLLFFFPLS